MQNFISNNKNLIGIVIVSNIFSVLMVFFRVYFTNRLGYGFMIWNLILAIIPALLSIFFVVKKKKVSVAHVIVFIVWLLFLPNTFYLITDYVHLRITNEIGIWFDILLLSSFAWNGVMLGIISLYIVHQYFLVKLTKYSNFSVIIILALSSFGIYLGRFLRWNSWDVVTNPGLLINDIFDRIVNPFIHTRTYGITIILTIFLVIIYFTIFFAQSSKSKAE